MQYSGYLNSNGKSVTKDKNLLAPKRSVLEEIGNSVSHGVGALFGVVVLIMMLNSAHNLNQAVGAWIYFAGIFISMTMSSLYHAFKYGTVTKRLFRRFDYISIYLLIGATFAPILLIFIKGVLGFAFFTAQWLVIAVGVTFIGVFGPNKFRIFHLLGYVLMGWSGLFFLPRMLNGAPILVAFILGGGIIYSLGIIPFALKGRVAHFIWHLFVLGGVAVQWIGIYLTLY
ncbi:MAG: hemolysin III family protein [Clostridia bacterium]|nr:hemolysin III family protein [Clostridia bacterium]